MKSTMAIAGVELPQSPVKYIGADLEINFSDDSKNGVYLSNAYTIPMMYFGTLNEDFKFTVPNIQELHGSPLANWYLNGEGNFKSNTYSRAKEIERLKVEIRRAKAKGDIFKQKNIEKEILRVLDDRRNVFENANSIIFKLGPQVKVGPYDFNKSSFPLEYNGIKSHFCTSADNTPFKFKSNETNTKSNKRISSALCIDLPKFTLNHFPFKSLPTPHDAANNIYESLRLNRKFLFHSIVYFECEFKNLKIESEQKSYAVGPSYDYYLKLSFAKCPISKLHVMQQDNSTRKLKSLASYELDPSVYDKTETQNYQKQQKIDNLKEGSDVVAPVLKKQEIKLIN